MGKKPVRKKKKLETTEFLFDLTAALRPKRKTISGGGLFRFHRNATEFRAKRIREIKRIFLEIKHFFFRISIFHAKRASRHCNVRSCPA